MKKNIISLITLASSTVFAQNVALDNLLLLSAKNYCYNISQGQYKNISETFGMNDTTRLSLAGLPVQSVSVNYPLVAVINSGEDLGKELVKNAPGVYTQKDLEKNPLKNTYAINNSIDLRFNESPGQLMNKLSTSYPGLTFKPELLGGGYQFKQEKPVNLSTAKNIVEFNKEYERYVSVAYTFNISALKGEFKGGSALSYQCAVNLVSPQSAQELAAQFKGTVKTVPQAK